jgi:hypothetical protein
MGENDRVGKSGGKYDCPSMPAFLDPRPKVDSKGRGSSWTRAPGVQTLASGEEGRNVPDDSLQVQSESKGIIYPSALALAKHLVLQTHLELQIPTQH